jgi:hypothetical protein
MYLIDTYKNECQDKASSGRLLHQWSSKSMFERLLDHLNGNNSDKKSFHEACPTNTTPAPVFVRDKLGNQYLRIDFCCADGSEADIQQLRVLPDYIIWSPLHQPNSHGSCTHAE